MVDLYVYYKVRDADTAQLAPLVRAMQARLAASEGASVQLKRRPGNHDGLQTWMEVYPAAPAGFDAALARAVLDAGLEPLLAGPRRVEVFTDLPPCA
jgi:uncharacterized protein DUF4936